MTRLEHNYPVIKYILPGNLLHLLQTLSRSHSNVASYEVLKGFLKLIKGKWDTFVKFQSIFWVLAIQSFLIVVEFW